MSQKEKKEMAKYFYRASAADSIKIPGSPMAYWVRSSVLEAFECGEFLGDKVVFRKGLEGVPSCSRLRQRLDELATLPGVLERVDALNVEWTIWSNGIRASKGSQE